MEIIFTLWWCLIPVGIIVTAIAAGVYKQLNPNKLVDDVIFAGFLFTVAWPIAIPALTVFGIIYGCYRFGMWLALRLSK